MAKSLNDFDTQQIFYAPTLVTTKSGGKTIYTATTPQMQISDRVRFQFTWEPARPTDPGVVEDLPTAPYGLSEPLAGGATNRLSLDLTIEDPRVQEKLEAIDAHNIQTATDKSIDWFKKQLDAVVIKENYTPIVKKPSNEKYKPTCRFKVQTDGDNATKIYVASPCAGGNEFQLYDGSHLDLKKSSKYLVVAETSGLWFQAKTFGMSFTATEIIVWNKKRPRGLDAFDFSQDVTKKVVPRPADDDLPEGEEL